MASLSQTIHITKEIIKWILIGIAGIILIFLLFQLAVNIYRKFVPIPPPKPDLTFGNLPPIVFPANVTRRRFTYIVNTISGTLPVFDILAPVYMIKQPEPNLLSLSSTENVINRTEFAGTMPQKLSDTVYTWSQPVSPFKRITIDTVNLDFTLTSLYLGDQNVVTAKNLPSDENGAISVAKDFFNAMSSYPLDIDETKTKTTILTINNNILVPATSLSTTQVFRVDFYQKDRNKMPIYYPHYPNSTINALIASGDGGAQVVEANYAGKTVEDTSATYPIITAQEAFQKLQEGSAYIANYYEPTTVDPENAFLSPPKQINITNVELGYYLGDEKKQLYMMPIIIFHGDNGFLAYVSAVPDQYLGNSGFPK